MYLTINYFRKNKYFKIKLLLNINQNYSQRTKRLMQQGDRNNREKTLDLACTLKHSFFLIIINYEFEMRIYVNFVFK